MCRFIAYKGVPTSLDDLLFTPKHSLINQSFEAKELEEPLNGDGFGVGWYVPEIATSPAVFVSMTPAWSNRNLKNLAPKIKSGCIFAHVRAASVGDISESNCHPFYYNDWMFMHNGGIDDFSFIKRQVRRDLSDPVYSWLKGQTDSEHFFGLFLDRIIPKGDQATPDEVIGAVEDSLKYIARIKAERNITADTYLNACVTNGRYMVGIRFCSDPKIEPLSLYYSTGTKYICEDGVCHMVHSDPDDHAAMIVSEKLTDIASDWRKVPANNFIVIHEDMHAEVRPVKV